MTRKATWNETGKLLNAKFIRNIHFENEDHGTVSEDNLIYTTQDGGMTWHLEDCQNRTLPQYIKTFEETSYTLRWKDIYERKPDPNFDCGLVNLPDNSQNTGLKITPNPTYDYFKFEGISKEKHQLSILDLNGRKVGQIIATPNENINISNLPAGLYFIKIEKDGYHYVSRLVKN